MVNLNLKLNINTSRDAINASQNVIITTFIPFFFKVLNLKNSPVLKAINARAISAIKSVPSIIFLSTRFRQYGPIIIPATI